MFPEYRSLIRQLKQENLHFSKLFEEHNALDHAILNLINNPITSQQSDIKRMKQQKLRLKEQLYSMLKQADQQHSSSP